MPKNIPMDIRPLLPVDWPAVRMIYKEGIATGNATFEDDAPAWEEWDSAHLRDGRLVAQREGAVVAWAALSPVSGRCVYSGVAEVSVYVSSGARGMGIGKNLLEALVKESELKGYWTLQAGIFPENEASLALHKACGFRIVGRRERLGKMDGRWRDVMLLERRSAILGT
jgi:phosphinothricin acetyltransferase